MKLDIKNKILVVLLFFLTCGSLNAFAQRKAAVGGQFSAWHNGKENSTTVFITPDIGYTLSSRWYLGTGIGYAFCDSKDTKVHTVTLNPYARYFYYTSGRVRLYVDSTVGFGISKNKGEDAAFAWQAVLKPGVILGLTDRFSLAAGFGFLGYRKSDNGTSALGDEGWGLDFSGNSLSFGFFYSF